jgi:hypothetical protein
VRSFELSAEDFELINPNSRTCPVFRTRQDAELVRAIYKRVPVLMADGIGSGNPWHISFLRMFDMALDSESFKTVNELEGELELKGNAFTSARDTFLPLYVAKMIHHFNHRYRDYALQDSSKEGHNLPDVPSESLEDPSYMPLPKYWIPEDMVENRLAGRWNYRWMIGWRDICRNTDERTLIASIIPWAAVGDTLLLALPQVEPEETACLLANLNSFVLDYVARQKIGGLHMKYHVFKQLPILTPDTYASDSETRGESLRKWIAKRVLELTYTAYDLAPFAMDLDYKGKPFTWSDERRETIRAELDARFFQLYGLERGEVEYVLGTFTVLRRREEAKFGEFRIQRLILEQFDRMTSVEAASAP